MKLLKVMSVIAASLMAVSVQPAFAESTVTVDNCWIRNMPAAVPSGGFFEAHNHSDKDIQLKSVSSPDYGEIMLHETKTEDGVSKMAMVHDVTIPANGTLSFKPGGYHIMLEQPRDGIAVGDKLKLEFNLSNGDKFTAKCDVKSPKDLSGVKHGHGMHDHSKHH